MGENREEEERSGRAKEAAGALNEDEQMKREGMAEQASASVKRTTDKAKQKIDEMADKLKDASRGNEQR